MFDEDDDFPDYFLDDEEEERDLANARMAARSDDMPRGAGRMISFSHDSTGIGTPADDDQADEAGEREDNNAPLRGCLSGWFLGVVLLGVVIIGAVGYFRYLSPVVDNASALVNVTNVERRGVFFKTYEAEIVDPEKIADTAGVYTHPRSVSVADEIVAEQLREARLSGKPVEISYEVYSATLPWRGESKIVVVSAKPAR